jgi:hypothetical protein
VLADDAQLHRGRKRAGEKLSARKISDAKIDVMQKCRWIKGFCAVTIFYHGEKIRHDSDIWRENLSLTTAPARSTPRRKKILH